MPDMLCPLVNLPDPRPLMAPLAAEGITFRRPNPWEATVLREFIVKHFTQGWADGVSVAFSHQPVTAFCAFDGTEIVGFSAYECTRRNFFGPTGVDDSYRGRQIGKVLFLMALHGLMDLGYAYCVIGAAGPVDFYRKAVGAEVITINGGEGIYKLKTDPRFS